LLIKNLDAMSCARAEVEKNIKTVVASSHKLPPSVSQ
jgi:hypothetical protein